MEEQQPFKLWVAGSSPVWVTGFIVVISKIYRKMEVKTKVCTKCGKELPLEMFGKGPGKDGRRSWCKSCMNVASREYHRKQKLSKTAIPNPALAEFTPTGTYHRVTGKGLCG